MTAAASAARSVRLFVALWPGDATRTRLAEWRDAIAWPPDARPVETARLHVTLHFIGAVPAARVAQVGDALAVPSASIALRFARVEAWHDGLVVLRPQREPPALVALHERLAGALRRLDLPVEDRPFRPHVTLARRAAGATLQREVAPTAWRTRTHALVESRPGRSGGYVVLRRYG